MFKETGVEGGKLQIDKWVGSFSFFESTVHLRLCKMVYNESVSRSVCPTLCDPVDCRPPGSSVHGFLQARILEWVDIPFSRGSSQPRDWTQVSCIAGGFLTIRATREAPPPKIIWTLSQRPGPNPHLQSHPIVIMKQISTAASKKP